MRHFTFTGGEPLMRPDIVELITFVGTHPAIEAKRMISNLQLMDRRILRVLKDQGFALSTSLPGLKTYHLHTGSRRPQRVLRWIREAHRIGLHVTVGVTVTRLNLDELYETVATALIHGSDTILLNRFLPGGRGLQHRTMLELDRPQINQMLRVTEEVLRRANRFGSVGTELPYCAVDDPEQYQNLHFGFICSAAKGFFVIDPSGYVRACNHSPVRIGAIDVFSENPYWQAFADRAYTPHGCVFCSKASYCDGGCRESAHLCFGAIDAIDPLFEDHPEAMRLTTTITNEA